MGEGQVLYHVVLPRIFNYGRIDCTCTTKFYRAGSWVRQANPYSYGFMCQLTPSSEQHRNSEGAQC